METLTNISALANLPTGPILFLLCGPNFVEPQLNVRRELQRWTME